MRDQAVNAPTWNLEIVRHNTTYSVQGQVHLQAPLEKVRALLLDFDRISQLHRSIQNCGLQYIFPDGRHHVRIQIQFCVLFFYFTLKSIQDFIWNEHTIRAVMLPEKNDFAQGELQWQLMPKNGGTHLQFKAELAPILWIPPRIGSYLLGRLLLEEAAQFVPNLEHLTGR